MSSEALGEAETEDVDLAPPGFLSVYRGTPLDSSDLGLMRQTCLWWVKRQDSDVEEGKEISRGSRSKIANNMERCLSRWR